MNNFELDKSPLYESFKNLKHGNTVYSKKYGLGQACGLYGEEIIVQFSNLRKRFSVEDKEIRKIPDNYFRGTSKKVKVTYEGGEMSYAEYRKRAGLTKKGIKGEKQKYITLKEATDILGISKAELFKAVTMNSIKTKTFGRSVMIHREEFLRLYKKSGKDK